MSPINHVPTSFSNPIQKSHYCRLLVSTNYYSNIYFGINFTLPISNKAVFALPNPPKKKKKRRKDKAVIVSMHYFIASLTEKTTLASWFTKEHLNNSIINAYDLFYYKICIDYVSEDIYIYIYGYENWEICHCSKGIWVFDNNWNTLFLQMGLEERDTLLQQRQESSSQTEIQKL